MYIEAYIEENRSGRLQSELSFLTQIYAELIDPDSLEGALNMKDTEPTLTEQILKNNALGRLQDSIVCFERMMHVNALPVNSAVDMIQCYLGLDQPETAIVIAEGLMKQLHDQNNDLLLQNTAEPLWRLGRFDELDHLIETAHLEDSPEWGIRCGKILLNFRKGNELDFAEEIEKSRLSVMSDLRIVGDEQNLYHKGYSNVMKLHLISEIEQARKIVTDIESHNISANDLLQKILNDWDARLQLLQPSAKIVEPVLCLRRIVLHEVKTLLKSRIRDETIFKSIERQVNNYIGKSWIRSTELAREAGMHQQADLYILNAETFKPVNLFIEKAKLFWQKGDQSNSFKVLERGIEELQPANVNKQLNNSQKAAHDEARFLIATYNAESLNINTESNRQLFVKAHNAAPNSEKCLVHYAQYLEKTLAALEASVSTNVYNSKAAEDQHTIMLLYCQSMLFGTQYIYQSMPRVLSIWLDFTANTIDAKANNVQKDHYQSICNKMNVTAREFSNSLPSFVFFTAFSQLVSRICHPSVDVWSVIKLIIVKLILAFPQQSMWMILCVLKSSYTSRVRRCNEVFNEKSLSDKSVHKLITDFNSLADKMIELTNKDLPKKPLTFSVNKIFPALPQLLARSNFSQILLPFEMYMQPVLPSINQRNDKTFNAFPNKCVYIRGIRDELTVLTSLQRPRRVTLMGSDGNDYTIMMKPKDDLRKDFRLMEFNAVVKRYLRLNSDARQRRLNIRTYAVLPLNEECGIVEWISNLQPYRPIIMGKIYFINISFLFFFIEPTKSSI